MYNLVVRLVDLSTRSGDHPAGLERQHLLGAGAFSFAESEDEMPRVYFEESISPGFESYAEEVVLPSGMAVSLRRFGMREILVAEDGHEDECSNLRAGKKNGAAIVELLNLVARAALGESQLVDEPDGDRLTLAELSLQDKLAILDRGYCECRLP